MKLIRSNDLGLRRAVKRIFCNKQAPEWSRPVAVGDDCNGFSVTGRIEPRKRAAGKISPHIAHPACFPLRERGKRLRLASAPASAPAPGQHPRQRYSPVTRMDSSMALRRPEARPAAPGPAGSSRPGGAPALSCRLQVPACRAPLQPRVPRAGVPRCTLGVVVREVTPQTEYL